MKLRNKEHKEVIADLQKGWEIHDNGVNIRLVNILGSSKYEYNSLEQFAKEWETIKEPLLKEPLLKESLKIWAKLNNFSKVECHLYSKGWSTFTAKNSEDYYINYEIGYELPNLEEKRI